MTDKKYDVYGMGNALVDMVFKVDEAFFTRMNIEKGLMTLIDEATHNKLLPHLTMETRACGGSAANTMIAVRQLGGAAFYSCRVAGDEMGLFYLEDLSAAGVHANLHPARLRDGLTGKCMVMVTPDADRTMCTHLGITETFDVEDLVPEALAQSRYLYIEGYLVAQASARPATIEAVRTAKRHGVATSLTLSDINMVKYFRNDIDAIIDAGIDLIFCNEHEALAYAETRDLREASERLLQVAGSFAITRGAKGVLLHDGKDFIEVAPCPVRAVDTVGAGDMFAGAFLHGITHGMGYAEAGCLANHAAAHVVAKFGPRLTSEEISEIVCTVAGNS